MSLDATIWAWKQRIQKNPHASRSAVKIVLVSLADRASEQHTCYPSIARLELDTELNRKTILLALRHLCEIGLIADTGERKGKTNQVKVYRLINVLGREDIPLTPESAKTNSTKSGTVKENREKWEEDEDASKESQKRNHSKSGTVEDNKERQEADNKALEASQIWNSSENGTVPNLPDNKPKFGTGKETQIRVSELPSIELPKEPSSAPPVGDDGEVDFVAWVSAKGTALKKNQQTLFATLWDAYEHKVDRAQAIDAFLKHLYPKFTQDADTNRALLRRLLEAIARHVAERSDDCTPLYFEKWIKNSRWEDESFDSSVARVGDGTAVPQGDPEWKTLGFRSEDQRSEYDSKWIELQKLNALPQPSDAQISIINNIRTRLRQIAPANPESCEA